MYINQSIINITSHQKVLGHGSGVASLNYPYISLYAELMTYLFILCKLYYLHHASIQFEKRLPTGIILQSLKSA